MSCVKGCTVKMSEPRYGRPAAAGAAWRILAVVWVLLGVACVNSSLPRGPAQADGAVAAAARPASGAGSAPSAPSTYRLQVGDTFDVKLFYSPELNDSVVVRPDGKISLQLIGEVQAAGQRPADLEQQLRERFSKVLRDPAVAVVVKQFGPRRIYVAGEVRAPGELALQDHMTALQAIGRAGFFTPDAETRNVAVLRYHGDSGPEFILLNVKAMIDGAPGASHDMQLQPLDIVFVPQTQIASVADFFSRYVGNIVPLWRNVGFSMQYFTQSARLVVP